MSTITYMICRTVSVPFQISLPDGVLPRRRHSTVAIELAPGLIEVTFFGGCPLWDLKKSVDDLPKLAGTVIMTFGMSTANVVHI